MSVTALKRSINFGYGSNLWHEQMDERCPDHKFLGIGILRDWRWILNARGYANIVPSPGEAVYGALYELSQDDEARLDIYEGVPESYEKQHLSVEYLGSQDGVATIVDGDKKIIEGSLAYVDVQRTEPHNTPQAEYIPRMNHAIADALREGVPEDYIEKYIRKVIPRS
ncbi:uncharacterized protein SCHCODRAFT_02605488 [Schizophyllum commune H4-8]|uniref:gamma-glutamylcyclotransferase n=1 Tax=Schizophyllum commune (strain H4-8 / FGSC 9210) TaxID=578458 RepID=D8PST6_SCHCM|nr:uncharacterized protein SCHCODRAFT_02605488 [Schizophyllum commune H4-8]KAI5899563.1 hypothetical protein SCHCODRAFT_02605488 [Schizophyllum commune H4-8]